MAIDPTARMTAVLLTAHGGPDVLELRDDIPVPTPAAHEVLIAVAAAGVNNTDINTRVGWYSKAVGTATADAGDVDTTEVDADGGWSGTPLSFPRIQGADVCGQVVGVGSGVDGDRIGERVICATMQTAPVDHRPHETVTLGSEMDGGFAQYVAVHTDEAYAVDCEWTDVELASIPCAYSTAENMLHRVGLSADERVLVTGASGGVGSAAVQLAKRRHATVIAVTSESKADAVRALGADVTLDRGQVPRDVVDVVVDLVGGPQFPGVVDVLRHGGRYITSGAIAGPIVDLDLRTLYLRDLTLLGATHQAPEVFENLIGYIERGEIRSQVAATYPLADIAQAQADFQAKRFVGKLVLIPPAPRPIG